MRLYRNASRYTALIGSMFVAGMIYLLKINGAQFPELLPFLILFLGALAFFLPARRLDIENRTATLLIREGRKARRISIREILRVVRDDDEIILERRSGNVMLFHSDFRSRREEDAFLAKLEKARLDFGSGRESE